MLPARSRGSSGVDDGSDVADHAPPRLDRQGSMGRSSATSSHDWAKNYLDDANGKSDLAQVRALTLR